MELINIIRRFRTKKELRDLKALSKDILRIKKRTLAAVEWRRKISQRIFKAVEALESNPADKESRELLVNGLERERQFLDMVRKGTKNTISILEATLKELRNIKKQQEKQIKRGRDPKLQKEYFEVITEMQTIQFLIDAMQFAKGKIKIIEKRIKKGEILVSEKYSEKRLKEFRQTMVEEEKNDRELALVLQGKSKKVRSKLNILKYMIKDKWIAASPLLSAPLTAGLSYGSASMGNPSPADSVETLVATIISFSLAVMVGLAYSTWDYEEGRRRLKGKVGDILKIPR